MAAAEAGRLWLLARMPFGVNGGGATGAGTEDAPFVSCCTACGGCCCCATASCTAIRWKEGSLKLMVRPPRSDVFGGDPMAEARCEAA